MLLFYTCIFLVIIGSLYGGVIQENEDDLDNGLFSKKAEIYFRKRCLKNEKQLDHLLKELDDIGKCIDKILPNHTESEENEEELEKDCFETRKEVLACLQRLVELLEPCLPPEEKYLPGFALEAFAGFSKYLCGHVHVLTPDGLLETNMIKCLNKFTRNKKYSPHNLCYESAKFGNHSHTDPILKEELCEDLDFIYNCYEEQFKKHCPDAPKAWEFEAGLLNGIRSPCHHKEKIEETETKNVVGEGNDSSEEEEDRK